MIHRYPRRVNRTHFPVLSSLPSPSFHCVGKGPFCDTPWGRAPGGPFFTAPAALLAHIVVGPEPVDCSDILAALQPALALAAPIAIAFAYTTRPIVPTVVHVPVRPATCGGFAHIVVSREPVAGPDILAALEPALTLAGAIAIALPRTARPIVPTVVYVPVLPAPGGGFAHIVGRREPVGGPDIPAALEPALTLAAPIAIALARTTRPSRQ